MRAILRPDPASGYGYGVLTVRDINASGQPQIIISRISDSLTLTPGGWQKGPHAIIPDRWENGDGILTIWLGPAIIDNLNGVDRYEVNIPGCGLCPLEITGLMQSNVIDDNGAGAFAPPPAEPQTAPLPPDSIIYEGVEKTPVTSPFAQTQSFSPIQNVGEAKKKHKGCMILSVAVLAIWLIISWLLWQGVKTAPAPAENESAPSFEIIPKSTEITSPDDNMGEAKN